MYCHISRRPEVEMSCLLAHLSRRLIGELLVYRGIRRPSSTFSNNFFSEAAGADSSHISYIASIGRGNE